MEQELPERQKKIVWPCECEFGYDRRHITGRRYNLILFVAVIIIFISHIIVMTNNSRRDIIKFAPKNHSPFNISWMKLNITLKDIYWLYGESEVFEEYNETEEFFHDNLTIHDHPYYNSSTFLYLWGKNWIFDAITCNTIFLDEHYKRSGLIVPWFNVFSCCVILIPSIKSILRNGEMFSSQFSMCIKSLLAISVYLRIIFMHAPFNYSWLSSNSNVWMIGNIFPEVILVFIWFMRYRRSIRTKEEERSTYAIDKHNYYRSRLYIISGVCLHLIYIFPLLLFASMTADQKDIIGRSTYLFLGACIYLILVIYYWGMLSVGFGISTAITDYYSLRPIRRNCCHMVFLAARYHFGTACQHASVIIPRVQTTMIMFEPEFKDYLGFSFFYKLYFVHWKIHGLSLMATSIGGCNHSEAIRELLRFFAKDVSKIDHFQNYGKIMRYILFILVPTNSLISLIFWSCGVADRSYSMGMLSLYFSIIGLTSIFMKYFELSSDTTMFHYGTPTVVRDEIMRLLRCSIKIPKTTNSNIEISFDTRVVDRDFLQQCIDVRKKMSTYRLNNRTTLLDFLRSSPISAAYAQNENLVKLVSTPGWEMAYPHYHILIAERYKQERERFDLLEAAENFWYFITGGRLPDNCVERIFSHLSNDELKKMVDGRKFMCLKYRRRPRLQT